MFEWCTRRKRRLEGIEPGKAARRLRRAASFTRTRMRRFRYFTGHSPGRSLYQHGARHQPTIHRSLRAAEDRQQPSGSRRTGTEAPGYVPVVSHRPSSGAMDPDPSLVDPTASRRNRACVAALGTAEEFFAPWEAAQPRRCCRVVTRFGQAARTERRGGSSMPFQPGLCAVVTLPEVVLVTASPKTCFGD